MSDPNQPLGGTTKLSPRHKASAGGAASSPGNTGENPKAGASRDGTD